MVPHEIAAKSWLVVAEGADHGVAIKKSASQAAFRQKTGEVAAQWLVSRDPEKRLSEVRWDDEKGVAMTTPWRENDRQNDSADTNEPPPKKRKGI